MGLQVLGTFSVGQSSFMVGGMHVSAQSELDGLSMRELVTGTRVIAITHPDEPPQLHPRRDTRLRAGDTAYLVGPYRELLATLRKGQPPSSPPAAMGTGQKWRRSTTLARWTGRTKPALTPMRR
ncbi:trkA-C domain protein [Mycobacterium ulcerans str. Harvey]|uniref:TrkA-C domain protein n=1 Tax=Mycobacterium ulcerans str. Harvey TaxID=1299332 RepID=A0ABN0QQR8_MYCUL|nr:trkA-C domain protein [Mycobacterium ulcerans str. Harvey]